MKTRTTGKRGGGSRLLGGMNERWKSLSEDLH